MSVLTAEKLEKLKILLFAAKKEGVQDYLKMPGESEFCKDAFPPFARILMFGIDDSMKIIEKKLGERAQGFDWNRDAPPPAVEASNDWVFAMVVGNDVAKFHGIIRAQTEVVLGDQRDPAQQERQNGEQVIPENPFKRRKYGPDNARGRSIIDHRHLMDGMTSVSLPDAKMFLLVPKNFNGVTLKQVFENAGNKGKAIYMYLGYSNNAINELARDKIIEKNFVLHQALIRFKHNQRDPLEWWEHLARLQIVFLALSIVHFKYEQLKPRMLVNFHERSLMSNVFGHLWREQRQSIIEDIEYIVDNPESVFCMECNKECEMAQMDKRWHIALNSFGRAICEKEKETRNTFLERHDLYHTVSPTLEPLYVDLLEVFHETTEFGKESAKRVIDVLEKSWNCKKNQEFTTYVIVIVDDVKARKSCEKGGKINWTSPEDLFKEQEVFVYVGFTKEGRYRMSNFSNCKRGLARLLTEWSRVFLVRNCTSTDILAVAFDEAFIYVLLKELRDKRFEENPDSLFFLVNERSEATKMFGTSREQYNTILDFLDDPDTVFDPAVEHASIEQPGVFAGRCGFEEITNEIGVELASYDEVMRERKAIKGANKLGEKRSKNRVIAHTLKPMLIHLDD